MRLFRLVRSSRILRRASRLISLLIRSLVRLRRRVLLVLSLLRRFRMVTFRCLLMVVKVLTGRWKRLYGRCRSRPRL